MTTNHRLQLGAALACCGAIGMLLAPRFGMTLLGRPWSFIVGFLIGISAGLGAALSVYGLLERRRVLSRSRPGNTKGVN